MNGSKIAFICLILCILGFSVAIVGMRIHSDLVHGIRLEMVELDHRHHVLNEMSSEEYVARRTTFDQLHERFLSRYSDFRHAFILFVVLGSSAFGAFAISKSIEEK